jgi:hypothetical protein
MCVCITYVTSEGEKRCVRRLHTVTAVCYCLQLAAAMVSIMPTVTAMVICSYSIVPSAALYIPYAHNAKVTRLATIVYCVL